VCDYQKLHIVAARIRAEISIRAPLASGLVFCLITFSLIPSLGRCAETSWRMFNRTITVQGLERTQDYVEFDGYGLTPDGIFDTEKGSIPGFGVQARWQGLVAEIPIWLRTGYQRLQGQTDYRGYLQRGDMLIPFTARTGNTFEQFTLTLGLPISLIDPDTQLIPFVELAERRWQRNLVDYGETYRTRDISLGLLTQWQPVADWTVEAEAQVGRQIQSRVNVPSLDFAADLDTAYSWQVGLGVRYQVTEYIDVGVSWSHYRVRSKPSDIINGLQAPESLTLQDSYSLGLSWHY
jgi:hypothetical protein